MSHTSAKRRPGFILAEALVALLILGVVFIALEGSLTIIVRTLADSERESIAVRIAETQRERVFATTCAAASGADSLNAVVVNWVASTDGQLARVVQSGSYPRRGGDRTQEYDALGSCR
jgi:Tfp pilus assembly protein PilV